MPDLPAGKGTEAAPSLNPEKFIPSFQLLSRQRDTLSEKTRKK